MKNLPKVWTSGRLIKRRDGAYAIDCAGDTLAEIRHVEAFATAIEGHPGVPPRVSDGGCEDWRKAFADWRLRVYASGEYKEELSKLIEQQKTEPFWFESNRCCYQGKAYGVDFEDASHFDREELSLAVKHFVVSQRQQFKRLRREIEAFENLERMMYREVIPESVRIFVWQRDQGKCVECGNREALEFD